MLPQIDRRWLTRQGACKEGKKWYLANCDADPIKGVKQLLDGGRPDWANWLLSKLLTGGQNIRYAVYAAKQVLEIYEEKYPDDKRPRRAIRAAERCLKNPTPENRAAADAADAADAAAYAAYAAMKRKIILYGIRILREEG